MRIDVHYWVSGVRERFRLQDYEVSESPVTCCSEMQRWWDVIIGVARIGPRRPESITPAVFVERADSGEGLTDGVAIRFCPFCASPIEIRTTLQQCLSY